MFATKFQIKKSYPLEADGESQFQDSQKQIYKVYFKQTSVETCLHINWIKNSSKYFFHRHKWVSNFGTAKFVHRKDRT